MDLTDQILPIDTNNAAEITINNSVSALENDVIEMLKTIYDPEIPVNIYDLGLIYNIYFQSPSSVQVSMTLTTPGCPVAQEFPGWVEDSLLRVEGIETAIVEVVWEPPWSMDCMSEAAKLELGML